jgi:hypothetical protein
MGTDRKRTHAQKFEKGNLTHSSVICVLKYLVIER